MANSGTRVAVGLSGGVDSSVAAALLKEEGYDVVGIMMEIFHSSMAVKEVEKHACYGPREKEDIEAAASVCNKLGIPFHIIDLRSEHRNHVIDYVRSEYLAARTPNPCVVCNRKLKFGLLPEKAKSAGIVFDFFATGHYAQIVKSGDKYLLKKAIDRSKDQSYFLYSLLPEQLSRTLFPLGAFTKQQVRKMARSYGLETADRPESQDFVAGGDYSPLFHKEEIEAGDIVDEDGNVLGKHRGIIHYTIGQRRGLGIASDRPLYVARINAETNRIVVSDRDSLLSEGLIATDLNLMAIEKLDRSHRIETKIRLQHQGVASTIFPHGNHKAKILFDEPQMAISPGQSAVFYSDDYVFGGGVIERGF